MIRKLSGAAYGYYVALFYYIEETVLFKGSAPADRKPAILPLYGICK